MLTGYLSALFAFVGEFADEVGCLPEHRRLVDRTAREVCTIRRKSYRRNKFRVSIPTSDQFFFFQGQNFDTFEAAHSDIVLVRMKRDSIGTVGIHFCLPL